MHENETRVEDPMVYSEPVKMLKRLVDVILHSGFSDQSSCSILESLKFNTLQRTHCSSQNFPMPINLLRDGGSLLNERQKNCPLAVLQLNAYRRFYTEKLHKL